MMKKKKIHSTQAIEENSLLLKKNEHEPINGNYFFKNEKSKPPLYFFLNTKKLFLVFLRNPREQTSRTDLNQISMFVSQSQENKIDYLSQDKKKTLNPLYKKDSTTNNSNNELNINYINLNYIHESPKSNLNINKNPQNLAYMNNISSLIKKIEITHSKNKNQYPFKYYNKNIDINNKNEKKDQRLFLEDVPKKELKSYQFILNLDEKQQDPEDVIEIKKKRISLIPGGFHMQKQNQLKKKVFKLLEFHFILF